MQLSSSTHTLMLDNVLHVAPMSMNLISVSVLCASNVVTILFFVHYFQVQGRQMGTIMVTGKRTDRVYLMLNSSFPIK